MLGRDLPKFLGIPRVPKYDFVCQNVKMFSKILWGGNKIINCYHRTTRVSTGPARKRMIHMSWGSGLEGKPVLAHSVWDRELSCVIGGQEMFGFFGVQLGFTGSGGL